MRALAVDRAEPRYGARPRRCAGRIALIASLRSPAERGRHVGEDAVDDVGVVVDVELVGHSQDGVGGCDRLASLSCWSRFVHLRVRHRNPHSSARGRGASQDR